MNPKISHIEIRAADTGGRWYAKETDSADKSGKTLVFFQRSGNHRSLGEYISDKLQGVRSGRSVAEKYMSSLGLAPTDNVRSAAPSAYAAGVNGQRLSDQMLGERIQALVKNIGTEPASGHPDGPGLSLSRPMPDKIRRDRDNFCTSLWNSYAGTTGKSAFMQHANDAFALARGYMTPSDPGRLREVGAFLQDVAAHSTSDNTLKNNFNAVQSAFERKCRPAGNAPADAPSLEVQLEQSLNTGNKDEFCNAMSREFVRVRTGQPDWKPETETIAFRARIGLAFDIAKDQQAIQNRIESVESSSDQARTLLYLSADRNVQVDRGSVEETLRSLASLQGLGLDPAIRGLLNDTQALVQDWHDQNPY